MWRPYYVCSPRDFPQVEGRLFSDHLAACINWRELAHKSAECRGGQHGGSPPWGCSTGPTRILRRRWSFVMYLLQPTFPRYRSPDSAAGPFEHHNNPRPSRSKPHRRICARQRARRSESWQEKAVSRPIGPLRRVWGHIDISGLSLMVGLADGWHPSYRRCPRRQRGESSNPFEGRSVQPTRNRHLCHLENHVLGMPNHFGPDLDQLLPQGRHRPRLHGTRQDKPPQKVAQVVRQANNCNRTWLSTKSWQESFVHFTTFFPSRIHCSAVPLWL